MANSRSNIYPIQLQGAELCLNRYDAEIKQYSGFNKNNSPFVGGCLSNVFTKDTTLEGATDDNTYIDENGDVYSVDTQGMYKNGEKVLDVDSSKLYDIEETEGLEGYDIVAMFDEKCFIYCVIDNSNTTYPFKFVFRFYDPNLNEFREEVIQRSHTYSSYAFDCKRVKCKDNLYAWVCAYNNFTFNSSNNKYYVYDGKCYAASYKDGDNVKYGFENSSSGYQEISVFTVKDNNCVCHALYDETVDKLYYFYFDFTMFNSFLYEKDIEINTEGESITFSIIGSNSYSAPDNTSGHFDYSALTKPFWPGSGFKYGFSQNKIWIHSFTGVVLQSATERIHNCYYKIVLDEAVGWKIIFYDGYSVTISPNVSASSERYKVFNFGILGVNSIYQKSTAKGYCDFESIGVSYDENEELRFNTGCVMSKMVLLNNEEVTGITLPDTQRILVTDWNSIDENKVFVPNNESGYEYCCGGQIQCIYKSNGKYYKLKKVDYVFMRLVNNQLVVNSDVFYNAYRITDDQKLLYAPSWNNRLPVRNCVERDTDINANKYYYASSMNEYNLQDNASLLLNPIPIVNEPDPSEYKLDIYREVNYKLPFVVNVYSGETVDQCKYFGSVSNTFADMVYISPLADLPFPIDTNGNVMYSPCLFSEIKSSFGNNLLIKNGISYYPLATGNDNTPVMSFYLASGIADLQNAFIIQGQYYGIINDQIYALSFNSGVINTVQFIVDVSNLQFVGNTPYEALFYSKTNRCLYSFTGANVLNQKQLVDKISEVRQYLYNPATQTVFLITDIGVLFYGLFGVFLLENTDITKVFLLDNGVVLSNNNGGYRYIKYYLDESDEDYTKQNICVETCFYGMNNQTVTINDCLYFRLFSEEHEEGDLKVSATTISLRGRKTEETTFKIKASDWDKITHTIYLRYQPKEQRGLGVSFSIDSPFKIASLSVGSQPDAILIDKVSKGAINAPSRTSNNDEW